jgi:hypothetical protein
VTPRIAAIVNRRAGRVGAATLDALARAVPTGPLVATASLAELEVAAGAVISTAPTLVVLVGGDGSFVRGLAAVTAACAAAGVAVPTIGVLAAGSGNAVARALGGRPGLDALPARLAAAAVARPRRLPLLAVEGVRAPFCGFGVDATLVADAERVGRWLAARGAGGLPPWARYAASVPLRSLPAVLGGRRAEVAITNLGAPAERWAADGTATPAIGPTLWRGACTLAACATIPYYGFGLRMFLHAERRADRFHVRAGDPGLTEMITSAPAAFAGRYTSPRVHDFACDAVRLAVDEPAPFEIAGDVVGVRAAVEVHLGAPIDAIAI